MNTQGHLLNNGGLRAHSVGEFYPFRIMAQGTPDNLRWWVIHPDGYKLTTRHTPQEAARNAREWFNVWSTLHA